MKDNLVKRAHYKKENRFLLLSMASGNPSEQVKASILIKYWPFDREKHEEECAVSFNIPGMDSWCPLELQVWCELALRADGNA